ncbi:MAG: hypothetical protein PHQ89_02300 [Bacilli bacterium]|nr:hypothetical protein [Bacilli bacterium]
MIITKNNYDQKMELLSAKNRVLSKQFLDMLKRLQITELNMASVGNSLSAGYSKCDLILPFLMRSDIFKRAEDINFYSFARVRHNEEISILRWYNENISHKDINDLNKTDIAAKQTKYVQKHWSDQTLKNYDEITNKSDIGLKDFNLLDNSIIIYNGFTGEFTNAMRKGTTSDKLKIFSTFKKDLINAKLVLMQMYLDNPNTQIYVCGLPNIMNTGIISVLDKDIKKLCEQIPNTVYLPGVVRNSFFYLDGEQEFDIHYSQPEYLQLWNNITNAMIENLLPKKLTTNLLERLRKYSWAVEQEKGISKGCVAEVLKIIEEEFDKYKPLFDKNNQNINGTIDTISKNYDKNYLSSFLCTPRAEVLDKLDRMKEYSRDNDYYDFEPNSEGYSKQFKKA